MNIIEYKEWTSLYLMVHEIEGYPMYFRQAKDAYWRFCWNRG